MTKTSFAQQTDNSLSSCLLALRKSFAFTLAEVLITLAIIGIVAAMTLPSLIAKHQEQVLVTKTKAAHSMLENAFKLYIAKNDCDNILCLVGQNKSNAEVAREFASVINNAKVCTAADNMNKVCKDKPLKGIQPYLLDGKYAYSDNFGAIDRIVTQNGVMFLISTRSNCVNSNTYYERDEFGNKISDTPITSTSDICAFVYIDINGIQGPNIHGLDVFRHTIRSNGKLELHEYAKNPLINSKVNDYVKYNIGDSPKN